MIYNTNDILRIAKRYNNNKRSYLLVNPLQAKHMPVSPSKALKMMRTLGEKLYEKYPDTRLIIGFAETATAIGAETARTFGDNCIYIHTTREKLINKRILFSEEHSHAVEQQLCNEKLKEFVSYTQTVIFIDDEISTGRTLINIINQMRYEIPELSEKKIVAASIINRVSDENLKLLETENINCEYLVKLENSDYESEISDISVESAKDVMNPTKQYDIDVISVSSLKNPRLAVNIKNYYENCLEIAEEIINNINNKILPDSDILVLGTEECMFPSLVLGQQLELLKKYRSVSCHSTTRSPIGIYKHKDYPISEGFKICGFYDENRETYIYNLKKYDAVIILTDGETSQKAVNSICTVLDDKCKNIFIFKG